MKKRFTEYLLIASPTSIYEKNHNVTAMNTYSNPWVMMFRGLHGLCVNTKQRWGNPADDYVLAPEIFSIAKALQNLLNFDNGQLDNGKCDSALRELLIDAGFTDEQVEEL